MSDRGAPSLAAPLSKALEPGPNYPAEVERILAGLRADPDVLAAMAEALHARCHSYTTQHDLSAHDESAAFLLDALFGTLGAGPISSGGQG